MLGTSFSSEREKNEYLQALGFVMPPCVYVAEGESLAESFRHFAEKRSELDYETDGVVMICQFLSATIWEVPRA